MEPRNALQIAVSDKVDDTEVDPSHVPLALIGEFQKDVAEFLRGASKELDAGKVMVSIQPGSLAFVASGLLSATGLWRDIDYLERSHSIAQIDRRRAAVITRWQAAARANPNRKYKLADSSGHAFLAVDAESDFRTVDNVWVHVEKYVHGKITDMGGKTKPNIHVELDGGPSMRISASQDQLAQGDKNRMYREELLHVAAEENLLTGELRNMRLLGFESYHPRYDENEFRLMVERGTRAWSDTDENWLDDFRSRGA